VTLQLVSPDYAASEYSGSSATGYPSFYTISGSVIATFPPSTADIIIDYYASIPALSTTNPTNWLLTAAPDVYLYGALMEAAPYMMDDQRRDMPWGQMFERACVDLETNDRRKRWPQPMTRLRGVTP
jgi:hypothetical protein